MALFNSGEKYSKCIAQLSKEYTLDFGEHNAATLEQDAEHLVAKGRVVLEALTHCRLQKVVEPACISKLLIVRDRMDER